MLPRVQAVIVGIFASDQHPVGPYGGVAEIMSVMRVSFCRNSTNNRITLKFLIRPWLENGVDACVGKSLPIDDRLVFAGNLDACNGIGPRVYRSSNRSIQFCSEHSVTATLDCTTYTVGASECRGSSEFWGCSGNGTTGASVGQAVLDARPEGSTFVELDKSLQSLYSTGQVRTLDELKALEAQQKKVAALVQSVAVNVRQGAAQGSGVLISRTLC